MKAIIFHARIWKKEGRTGNIAFKSILLLSAFISIANLSNKEIVNSNAEEQRSVTSIIDNGVYFIRNYGSGKYIDVPNGNFSENVYPIQYSYGGGINQRFVITKEFYYDGSETYRIKPVYNQDLCLKIENNSANQNAKVVMKNEEYSDLAVYADKFTFFNLGNGLFNIGCYSGINNYYLGVDQNSNNNSANLVQNNLPSTVAGRNYYTWELILTDSINVFEKNEIDVSGNSYKQFNLKVPYSVQYVLTSTTLSNTKFSIYEVSGSSQIYLAESNQQELRYTLDSSKEYKVRVYNLSSLARNITFYLVPSETLFHYGVWDQNNNDQVTSPFLQNKHYLYDVYNGTDIFPFHYANVSASRVLENIYGSYSPLKSKYSVITCHGGPGYICTRSGDEESSTLSAYSLPLMPSVEMVAWYSCDGASYSTTNYNLARQCVVNGAHYSLGFRGEIYTNFAREYAGNLMEAIGNGYQGIAAVYQSYVWTSGDQWAVFYFAPPNNREPYLYYRDNNNNIVYSIVNTSNPVVNSDDLNSRSSVYHSSDILDETSEYININTRDGNYKLAKINGLYTNILFNEKAYLNIDVEALYNANKQISFKNCLQRDFLFKNNGVFEIYRVILNDDEIKVFNLTENIEVEYDFFVALSNQFRN